MSKPIKHHFSPQFYLKNWNNNDEKICCFRKINNKFTLVSAKNISYEKNLYTFENEIESIFITPFIDNRFSILVNKAKEFPIESLTKSEKFELIKFIIIMHLRNPIEIKKIKSYQKEMDILENYIVEEWKKIMEEDDFDEFEKGYIKGIITMVGLSMKEIDFSKNDLEKIKKNKNLFEFLYKTSLLSQQSWSAEIINKYKAKKIFFCEYLLNEPELLTSNSPVYFGKPNGFLTIMFNISPKKGYIITEDKNFIKEFNDYNHEKKVCFLNQYHIHHENIMEIYMHESQKEKYKDILGS